MSDDQQALNDAGAAPTSAPIELGDGLVSTVEFSNPTPAKPDTASPDGGAKPEGQDAAADDQKPDAADSKESDASSDAAKQGGRLDRDSRFQQVIQTNNHLKQQLKDLTDRHNQVLERLDKLATGQAGAPGAGDAAANKVFGMTEEELLDLQATNPAKYHQMVVDNITRQVSETVAKSVDSAQNQRDFDQQISQTYEQYAKDHPDFEELWDSGEIRAFMDTYPGHNAISAHMAMTQANRVQAAVDKAVKTAQDKMLNDLRTKGRSALLGGGPSGQIDRQRAADQELQDSKKYGGKYAVLARRSAARRNAG